MKYLTKFLVFIIFITALSISAQVTLESTSQKFENGETLYEVHENGLRVGIWMPINSGISLITKESHGDLLQRPLPEVIETLSASGLVISGIAPDGMTSRSNKVEGKHIIDGNIYQGDGTYPNYGLVHLYDQGKKMNFFHKSLFSQKDLEKIFAETIGSMDETLFFLPSIWRWDYEVKKPKKLSSKGAIQSVLVRRYTCAYKQEGYQDGVLVLDQVQDNNYMIAILEGLDVYAKSKRCYSQTMFAYVLDGGPVWGQVSYRTNGEHTTLGNRDPTLVTSYVVIK